MGASVALGHKTTQVMRLTCLVFMLLRAGLASPDGTGHHHGAHHGAHHGEHHGHEAAGHHGQHHAEHHGVEAGHHATAHHAPQPHHAQVPHHGAAPHQAAQHHPPPPHHAVPQQHGRPQNVPLKHSAPHPIRVAPRPKAPHPSQRRPAPQRVPFQRAPFQRQVPRRRPAPFFKGPPRSPVNPFLNPGNPRPERSNLHKTPQQKPRFPPQKPVRQPIGNSPQNVPTKNAKPINPIGKSLAQELKENEHFSTLYTALKAADLVTTLDKSSVHYTLFAPTNAAFDKVPVDTLNDLLNDKEALRKVLLRHVVPNKNMFGKDIPNGETKLKSASGEEIKASRGKYVQMTSSSGKAFVVKFDFPASNGVYHAVDQVL